MPGVDSAAETTLRHTDAFLDEVLDELNCGGALVDVCGHVDPNRIVWIGHSRGANAVVFALNRLEPTNSDYYPAGNYTASSIRLVSSMAPLDVEIDGQLAMPGNTPYHLFVVGGYNDISRILSIPHQLSFQLLERATGPRSSIYIHGGGHGWFHERCPVGGDGDCKSVGPSTLSESPAFPCILRESRQTLKAVLWESIPRRAFSDRLRHQVPLDRHLFVLRR